MNQLDQGSNAVAPPNIPIKRKRGRPRKDRSLSRREVAHAPSGFQGLNGNQSRQLVAIEDTNHGIVGQPVTGVVEAAFDAGYLLCVRIGNSNTSLRGVVFKPGHQVPISAENDVAPHVQTIRRNELPLPMENQPRKHGLHPRSKERTEQHSNVVEAGYFLNGSLPANRWTQTTDLVASKGKHVSPVSSCPPVVPPVGYRGTMVPVILQPVNLSNGLLFANVPSVPSQADLIAAQMHNPGQTVASQVPPSQPQTSHHGTPVGVEEVKSMKQTGLSTPSEVNKRVGVSSQSSETHIEGASAGKSSAEGSSIHLEGDIDNMNRPLLVEPLQAIHSDIHNRSEHVPKRSENNPRMGRMTELLQAMQENMVQSQALRVENVATETVHEDAVQSSAQV